MIFSHHRQSAGPKLASKTPQKSKLSTLYFHCSILALICQVFFAAIPVNAATSSLNNFYFDDFTADYYLSKAEDGTSRLYVYETLTAVFPEYSQNHGITRVIPYTNQNGENLTMVNPDVIEINIWHNGEEVRPYKVEGGEGYFMVYIGDPDEYVTGEQVYELEYEFRNVITKFEEDGKAWQELYWDTNGNDWSQKFNQVTARVHFDDDTGNISQAFTGETSCYVGRYGTSGQDRCQTKKLDDGVEFSAKKLLAGENLTFDLEFEPNTFVVPGKALDYRLVWVAVIAALIFIALLIAGYYIIRVTKDKREYYKKLFVKPEYTPPQGFTVAEMGENYIKKSKLGSTKVAILMELAVQHKVELVKTESKGKFGKTKTVWKIRIKSLDLNLEQITMLKILAGGTLKLSTGAEIEVKSRTATKQLIELGQNFDRYARDELRAKGLMESGKVKKSKSGKSSSAEPYAKNPCGMLIIAACAYFFVGIFGCSFIFADLPSYRTLLGEPWLIIVLIVLFALTIILAFVISIKFSPYFSMTKEGLKYSRYLDGLKMYIGLAEAERLKVLQSVKGADTTHQGVIKVYEKLLPYAVLFKQEKSWLNEMSRYYELNDVSEPMWYVGVGAFSAREFSSAMNQASSFIATSTAHSTTSNSSSGFSGGGSGGFSGGGGGGGGGGGW